MFPLLQSASLILVLYIKNLTMDCNWKTINVIQCNGYSLRKHLFLLALRRWGRFAQWNV